jgi:hypothetical protein
MKAAVWYAQKDVRVVDVLEPPQPPKAWVKIKVEWCGICGSDLHEYVAGPIFIPVGAPHPLTGGTAPVTLGHEFSGTIVEVGEGVTKFKVGDKVAPDACQVCWDCYSCKRMDYPCCEKLAFTGLHTDGAFAEYVYSPLLSFTGDISYMQNGTKSKDIILTRKANNEMGFEELGTLDERYDYISFAPMIKAKYENGSIVPFAVAGPSVNFLIGTNEQGNYEAYNKMVLGYAAGIGTEINVNLPFSLMMELLYNHDITYAYKSDYLKVRNYSFAFLFGVKF